jgi:hypothetical protein
MKRIGFILLVLFFSLGIASCGTVEKCPAFIGSLDLAEYQSEFDA